MNPREIKYINHGICVEHDQPCAILPEENAVLIMGCSYFQPSWKAQKLGYKLVKADSGFKKMLLQLFFKSEFEIGGYYER